MRGYGGAEDSTTKRARRLRRDTTKPEAVLWRSLRGRQLDRFKFRRQVPIGRYFADFAGIEARLVVEIDGGSHIEGKAYDDARTEVLEQAGYTVLRFWNDDILDDLGGALDLISKALKAARP